ncbi:MAG: CPBP family intramembrane glutamic endopeptidase [Puniceicoccales bacterium]
MSFLQSDGWVSGLIYGGIALVVLWFWISDCREGRTGGFPGASLAPVRTLIWAGIGGLALTLLETWGESLLGLTAEQTEMAAFALVPVLAAAVIEEIVFRGYLVVDHKGKAWLVGSIFGFSLIFSLIHPYLWSWEDGQLSIEWTTKGVFSTVFVLVNSLWFYTVRFSLGNRSHSLLPCFVAHGMSNFAVWAIKGFQGYLTW